MITKINKNYNNYNINLNNNDKIIYFRISKKIFNETYAKINQKIFIYNDSLHDIPDIPDIYIKFIIYFKNEYKNKHYTFNFYNILK